jgi:hypothetical protein
MTKLKHFAKVKLNLEAVKEAVISSLETKHPSFRVSYVEVLYQSSTDPGGYYESPFSPQREFSGFEIIMEPECTEVFAMYDEAERVVKFQPV